MEEGEGEREKNKGWLLAFSRSSLFALDGNNKGSGGGYAGVDLKGRDRLQLLSARPSSLFKATVPGIFCCRVNGNIIYWGGGGGDRSQSPTTLERDDDDAWVMDVSPC